MTLEIGKRIPAEGNGEGNGEGNEGTARAAANFKLNNTNVECGIAESIAPLTMEISVHFKSRNESRRGRIRKGYQARIADGAVRVVAKRRDLSKGGKREQPGD